MISAVFAASSETCSAGCASIFFDRSLAPDMFESEYGRHCDGENCVAGRTVHDNCGFGLNGIDRARALRDNRGGIMVCVLCWVVMFSAMVTNRRRCSAISVNLAQTTAQLLLRNRTLPTTLAKEDVIEDLELWHHYGYKTCLPFQNHQLKVAQIFYEYVRLNDEHTTALATPGYIESCRISIYTIIQP